MARPRLKFEDFVAQLRISVDMPRSETRLSTWLVWGPFENLGKGRYELEIYFETAKGKWYDFLRKRSAPISYEVSCHGSGGEPRVLATGSVHVRATSSRLIELLLEEEAPRFEIRMFRREKGFPPFWFCGARLRRFGPAAGIHQSEAFAMLVALFRSRMTNPYRETLVAQGAGDG
jgi:hypothetical protein